MPRAASSTRGRRIRRAIVAAGVVVALAAIAFVGGAWYYSDQLRDALLVTRATPYEDLVISPAGDDRILVRGAAGESWVVPFLRRSSTWGIAWRGGYGQTSGRPLSSDRTSVVLTFRLQQGAMPAAGTKAALEDAAFPPDPARTFGTAVRTVAIRSDVGAFPAYLATPQIAGSGDWAILVHGLGDTRDIMFRPMRSTLAAGWTSLDISYRNDIGTPGDPSGIAQMGRTEWVDLAAAVRYAEAHGATRILLCGASMGAAVIAAYLRHRAEGVRTAQGPPVAGVVLDSPMLDFAATVDYQSADYPLPVLGTPPPAPLTWAARMIAAWRFGIDWTSTDYVDGRRWATMPVLVEQGTADGTVPPATARRFARLNRQVQLVLVPGADHEEVWNRDPAAYDARVRAFLVGLGAG